MDRWTLPDCSCQLLQVLPATSSDLVSMDRDLISAQRDRAFMSPQQQSPASAEGMNRSKPTSFLSMDKGGAAGSVGSFSSHDKLQGMLSFSDSMHVQHAVESGMAAWGQQSRSGTTGVSSSNAVAHSSGARHTHDD